MIQHTTFRRRVSARSKMRFETLEQRCLLTATLQHLGTYDTGFFDEGAAEIVAHDPVGQRLYVVNSAAPGIDVLQLDNTGGLSYVSTLATGDAPTSVTVRDNLVAIAVPSSELTGVGRVMLFETSGEYLTEVSVGSLPDMVTFTPDGTRILVANEGETDYAPEIIDPVTLDVLQPASENPEGSVSIITLPTDVTTLSASDVVTAGFTHLIGMEDTLRSQGIRIYGPGANAAQDLEPEYITVSDDSTTAWITLQEANAIAQLDLATGSFDWIKSLGYKDHLAAGNGLDPSDRDGKVDSDLTGDDLVNYDDYQTLLEGLGSEYTFGDFQRLQLNYGKRSISTGAIHINNWPVKGMYQPDAIAHFAVDGETYLVTANEGDTRDTDYYSEEGVVGGLNLSPELAASTPEILEQTRALSLKDTRALGRLVVTTAFPAETTGSGTAEDPIVHHALYSNGARSFTIWNSSGELVFDSGDQFERIIAERAPNYFNSNEDAHNFDNRSDNKGPEPEAVAIGEVNGRTYAFIGLERVGGIMIFDVSNPTAPVLQDYVNNRDFLAPIFVEGELNPDVGDLGIEGMIFVPAVESPTGLPLVITASEISGTTSVFQFDPGTPEAAAFVATSGPHRDDGVDPAPPSDTFPADLDLGDENSREEDITVPATVRTISLRALVRAADRNSRRSIDQVFRDLAESPVTTLRGARGSLLVF